MAPTEQAHDPDCVFCRIVARDLPARVVASDAATVAFLDVAPGSRGHLLVVPRRHARDLLEIAPEDLAAVTAMGQAMARRAVDSLGAEGVNLVNSCGAAAWQTVFHFHLHVIPRYAGDGLRLPWTPQDLDAADLDAVAAALAP